MPPMVDLLIVALVFVAVLFPFLVVQEALERWGYDRRSFFVRIVVWSTFLILVLLPAALSGYLGSIGPIGWGLLFLVIVFAMAWEYHRLHPKGGS